jgi:hypothetical protein
MDKKNQFRITLAVTAFLVVGGVWFISQQSSEVDCPYCGVTYPSAGELSMHKIRCEQNTNDATMNTKGTGKVRNNDDIN